MALADQSRYDLHRRLAGFLDEETATDLMASLPPIEWRDVATKHDLDALRDWAALRFDDVDRRFEVVDRRFDEVDRRFAAVDERFEQVDRRFEQVDRRFDEMAARFDEMSRRFDDLGAMFATKDDIVAAMRHHTNMMVTVVLTTFTVTVGAVVGTFAWVAG